jgi:class 3 adenylate cyclase
MNVEPKTHIFISYLREDKRVVDLLCQNLKSNGLDVWLDREKIRPGERWQIAIRRAIEDGAFFIACFSEAHVNRDRSYMNVELAIAVEQLALRPADRAWFIPVILKGGRVPDRPIGGGETLRDLQWVDLNQDWDEGLRRILGVLCPEPLKPAPLEQQRLVILMTDIVGSTSSSMLSGPNEFHRIIRRLSECQGKAVEQYGGRVISRAGDGMVASFVSVARAVQCAQAIQRDIARIPSEKRSLALRIGLAEEQIVQERDFVAGWAVVEASRICSLAEGGEILTSESVGHSAANDGWRVRARGPIALKGFAARVQIYEILPPASSTEEASSV